MTDKQPEALIRAEELEQIGAESSLARAMAAHTIRLLYKENEALRARLSQCERCGEVNPAEIHTCTPPEQEPIAYLCENAVGHKYFRWKKPPSTYKPIALYTAHASPQRIWQGLTDEEYEAMAETYVTNCYFDTLKYAKAIEAKLKEKNT
jgi:hypothetical protein